MFSTSSPYLFEDFCFVFQVPVLGRNFGKDINLSSKKKNIEIISFLSSGREENLCLWGMKLNAVNLQQTYMFLLPHDFQFVGHLDLSLSL